ncbi:hypothetical protein BKA70DRAFT_1431676 [Coprinopsis sp. MPI-PUGE-AT-0042]|nr:hypothetical protein BKA70DRAFT_1431676 [Coprinopsis sp. MPI-PUGE-AT-0042]
MDITYDESIAKTLLDAMHGQREKGSEAPNIDTAEWSHPSILLATRLVDPSADGEDVGFKIQGVLCAKELPPLKLQIVGLRQHVCVTGLGAEWFKKALEQVEKVHNLFKASLPANTLYQMEFPFYEGYQALEAHTRYFTDRSAMPMARNQPFQPLVDPDGTLRALQPQNLLHAQENEVDYVRRMVIGANESFDAYDPALFTLGDLVEATFVCHCVPTRGGMYKMILGLRALSHLHDGPHIQEDTKLAIAKSSTPTKRKRYYGMGGSTDVETTRRRLNRLSIKP